jgi:hypothetical protein
MPALIPDSVSSYKCVDAYFSMGNLIKSLLVLLLYLINKIELVTKPNYSFGKATQSIAYTAPKMP